MWFQLHPLKLSLQTQQMFTLSSIFCSLMSFLYLQLPLPPHPCCYRHHHHHRKRRQFQLPYRKQNILIFSVQYGNFAEGKYFTCDELCATTHPQSTIPLPQGVNNILCAFLVKVKVSPHIISALLYFKSSLIKGSSGGRSHSAVRVTHLISPSAPQRAGAVQATRLHLPNLHRPTGRENWSHIERWHY